MDINNIEYIMDLFKTLTGEMPDQMLYRENGDSIELKTPDDSGNGTMHDLQNAGWNLISCRIHAAA